MTLDIISLINHSWDLNIIITALFYNPFIPDPMTVVWGIITLLFIAGMEYIPNGDNNDDDGKKRRSRRGIRQWFRW